MSLDEAINSVALSVPSLIFCVKGSIARPENLGSTYESGILQALDHLLRQTGSDLLVCVALRGFVIQWNLVNGIHGEGLGAPCYTIIGV